ncbi:hypothetical protein [Methanosarcina horonobensis]|uniref:hypothetical protein n=1 Tax=Methanosarcina horonobensis TaxID=418008 RepID=UPI000A9F91C3|nr:hypothetical protein [Methanosarcina horonobensis]
MRGSESIVRIFGSYVPNNFLSLEFKIAPMTQNRGEAEPVYVIAFEEELNCELKVVQP